MVQNKGNRKGRSLTTQVQYQSAENQAGSGPAVIETSYFLFIA